MLAPAGGQWGLAHRRAVAGAVHSDLLGEVGGRHAQGLPGVGGDQLAQLARLAEGDGAQAVLDALCLHQQWLVRVGWSLLCAYSLHQCHAGYMLPASAMAGQGGMESAVRMLLAALGGVKTWEGALLSTCHQRLMQQMHWTAAEWTHAKAASSVAEGHCCMRLNREQPAVQLACCARLSTEEQVGGIPGSG